MQLLKLGKQKNMVLIGIKKLDTGIKFIFNLGPGFRIFKRLKTKGAFWAGLPSE